MLNPSIDEMFRKIKSIDSKYTLVVAVSRRARQLRSGQKSDLKKTISHKYVGIALEELFNENIYLDRIVDGVQVHPKTDQPIG